MCLFVVMCRSLQSTGFYQRLFTVCGFTNICIDYPSIVIICSDLCVSCDRQVNEYVILSTLILHLHTTWPNTSDEKDKGQLV